MRQSRSPARRCTTYSCTPKSATIAEPVTAAKTNPYSQTGLMATRRASRNSAKSAARTLQPRSIRPKYPVPCCTASRTGMDKNASPSSRRDAFSAGDNVRENTPPRRAASTATKAARNVPAHKNDAHSNGLSAEGESGWAAYTGASSKVRASSKPIITFIRACAADLPPGAWRSAPRPAAKGLRKPPPGEPPKSLDAASNHTRTRSGETL